MPGLSAIVVSTLGGALLVTALAVGVAGRALDRSRGGAGMAPQATHLPLAAQHPAAGDWGDQRDGTYANPVMPGDFSDLDAIRIGSTFYAISSTFQYSPGMAVLASRDLVNWRIIGHVVGDLSKISPALNWDRMDRAGRGIWAGSIRFHAGRYFVFFGTPDEGLFQSTAPRPAGPWTDPVRVLAADGWDDPCPFWDDDGTGYLVTTHYKPEADGSTYNIHLFRLSSDGQRLVPGSDRIIHQSKGSEANKLYKIHGFYFHIYSEVADEGRVVMAERSHHLEGPWETRQLIHVHADVDKEPNQGGLIQISSGAWYFVTHQGTGDWEGRAGVLLPVTWIDGWPALGRAGADGIGNMVWRGPKPIPSTEESRLVMSDDFSEEQLKPQWEWNYQPRPGSWSLQARPGSLRMTAFPSLRDGDFFSIGNILTQRSMRTKRNTVTIKLDVSGMVDGQQAGLAHYSSGYSMLGVLQQGSNRTLIYKKDKTTLRGPALLRKELWLRSTWNFEGVSQCSYSLDGVAFTDFGDPYQLTWGNYRGDRIGILTSKSGAPGGFVDVDSFRYEISH